MLFATDESLQDLGLTAKGDIFAVKAFCQRQKCIKMFKKGREKVKSRKTISSHSQSGNNIS